MKTVSLNNVLSKTYENVRTNQKSQKIIKMGFGNSLNNKMRKS